MGREIRRVPEGWEHPRGKDGKYLPMHDETYVDAADKWVRGFLAWEAGEDERKNDGAARYFWDWGGGPPDEEYHRLKFESEPTHYQVYQTVSEGTPVTPSFATEDALIDYLCEHGEFGCQRRGERPPSREAATQFVKEDRWAPSGIIVDGRISMGIDSCGDVSARMADAAKGE